MLREHDEEALTRAVGLHGIPCRSERMRAVVERAVRIAGHDVPVLILGESGTGKERFARAIHAASRRAAEPFVAQNCGAIPFELVESELFGHVRGAFTGATHDRQGRFVAADRGTLFLDEIGDLPPAAQVKVLRVVESGEVTPVGASRPVRFDTRILAATNADLSARVASGSFRADLYHRIAVGILHLPPLRDRGVDIEPLVRGVHEEVCEELAVQPEFKPRQLTDAAVQRLARYPWPGNLRELRNVLVRLVIWSPGSEILESDVEHETGGETASVKPELLGRPLGQGFQIDALKAELESHYIRRALREARGNKAEAARLLGLGSAPTLTGRMRRYGIA